MKVLLYEPLNEGTLGHIRKSGLDIELVVAPGTDRASMLKAVADCDILLENLEYSVGIDKEMIDAAKHLKLIVNPSIGYDTIDAKYAEQCGIYVANSAGASTAAVAEGVILMMLGCNRNEQKISEKFRKMRGNYPFFEYNDPWTRGIELAGKTLALLGCGAIGREVARIAVCGFGMKAIGYDPYLELFPDYLTQVDSVDEVFARGDFVSLHLPSTPKTQGSIGMAQFKLMKPTAYFINSARGNITNEPELIEALSKGIIRGAGLDVYDQEPIAESSYGLFEQDRVFMMPHTAAFTLEASARYDEYVALNIIDVAGGNPPRRAVNQPAKPRLLQVAAAT